MSLLGKTVGHIRIVDSLGQGGMGEVYVGYDETLKRRVALKAIRGERRLEAEAKARFLREARILSRLDHPGICQIHEFIEGDDSDFLVLELIDGKTLRAAVEEDELDFGFKLHIAERVAEALMAAHAKGVAHRDLKPDNVMLTPEGGVKVLDFGLAYPVDETLLTATRFEGTSEGEAPQAAPVVDSDRHGDSAETAPGLRTPEPEAGERSAQTTVVRQDPPETDSEGTDPTEPMPFEEPWLGQSDAEPLGLASDFVRTEHGVVMGTVAYMSPEQARSERPTEAGDLYSLGLILQELFTGQSPYEPDLPFLEMFHRVALAKTLPVAGTDPDLAQLITHLKSLDPAARPSALETAERLRWIRGKPGRTLLRRLAAAMVVLIVFAGLKYSFDLRRERAEAVAAQREAEEVSEFLVRLFEVSDPQTARGESITARELLATGAERIVGELRGQPQIQSRVMFTLGRVHRQLGLYERAETLAEEALTIRRRLRGDDHLEIAQYLDLVANVYHDQGDYGRARPYFLRALEIREEALGRDHSHVAASLGNLAFLYRAQGDLEAAEPLFVRALEIQRSTLEDEHPDVAAGLNNLGDLYRARGDYRRAEAFLLEALEIQERSLGDDHPAFAVSANNLAMLYYEQGRSGQAEPLFLRTLGVVEKVLGTDHPSVATYLNNLAELYRSIGEYARAEPLYRRALVLQEQALGSDHPSVAVSLGNLANLLSARGRGDQAAPLYQRALAIQEGAFGPKHPQVAVTLNHWADLLAAAVTTGEADIGGAESRADVRSPSWARAEELYRRALEIQEAALGGDHPSVTITLADLAHLNLGLERYDQAELIFGRALAAAERQVEARPESRAAAVRLAKIQVARGRLLSAQGHPGRARESWLQAAAGLEALTFGAESVARLETYARALLHLGRLDEARPIVTDLLARGYRSADLLALCRRHGLA